MGYCLHGLPHLIGGVDSLLQPDMVINIEPSVFAYDGPEGGDVELEDTLLITEAGSTLVTPFPFDERLLH